MQHRIYSHFLIITWLIIGLTGCLSGGGSDSQSTFNTITEVTDERIARVTLLVTDDFQRANGQSFILLTVIARDSTNAPLVGVEVNLTSTSNFAVFIDPRGVTGENGRFTTGVVSSVAETFQVLATAGGVQGEPVNVTFVAPVDQIELTAEQEVLASGETTRVTVTIRKEFTLEPLPNAPFTVTAPRAQLGKIPTETDTNGQATFSVTGENAATVTVTVTSGSLTQTLKLYFGATLSLLPESSNALNSTTLTALLKDSTDTPIAGQKITFNFIGNNNATLTPTIAITGEDGTAQVTITDLAQKGGQVEINANSGTLTAPATVRFGELLVDPRIATVKLIAIDDFQRADGSSPITLTVIVRDANGIPLTGIPVNLLSDSDSAFFTELNGLTEADGHFTTSVSSRIAQSFQVTPTAGGIKGEPITVTFIAPAGSIQLTTSEAVLSVGETATVTVTIRREFDAINIDQRQGEPLPNATFEVNKSGNAVLGEIPLTTDEKGQAHFTVTDDTPESVIITVISGPLTQTISLHFGASLKLLPELVNTIDETPLRAILKDGNNTPLEDQPVTFSFVESNDETLSPTVVKTGVDGTAEVTVVDLAKDGGQVTVKASSGLLSAEATVQFKSNFRGNRQLAIAAKPTVLNEGQFATITAHITNDKSLPIEGQVVNFTVTTVDGSTSHAQLSTLEGISDENGEVKTTVSSSIGENVLVTVEADTAKQEIPLYFGAQLDLLPSQAEGIADGQSSVALTAILKDTTGIGIPNIPVTVRVTPRPETERVTTGSVSLTDFRPRTNELGRAQVGVTSIFPESVTIEAQVDNLTPLATSTIVFKPSEPRQIVLSSNINSLSLNGKAIIVAEVKDSQGNPVKEGTRVRFTTIEGGVITESALTENGIAEATFSATNQAGLVTITATAGSVTENLTLTIQPGDAGIIEMSQIEPKVIGVIGSGVPQIATIEFLVKDNLGNPVADDTEVNFSLGDTILGGGESITTAGQSGSTATGKTNNGLVRVALKSGLVAGNIDVIATVNDKVSTTARVTIVGSDPEAKHLSLATEFKNLAGGVTFGLQSEMTAYVGDRFGNIVPDGTAVTFISEGGTIGTSIGGGAFTTTTQFGQATAILQTANPTVPLLGGVPTFRNSGYQCSGNYALVADPLTNVPLCGNPGLVTVVVFTSGSESFIDVNGNGHYDLDEPFDDVTEPYIDGNENNRFDTGELYIDVNNNGQFDQGNKQFDGPGGSSPNTTIWQSQRVLFSDQVAPFQIESTGSIPFSITNGGSQTFTIKNVGDNYGNALVAGTRLTVTATQGILGGQTNVILEDSSGRGIDSVQFTLSSKPPDVVTTTENEQEISQLEYPPPESATITIKIESPFQERAPGGNGSRTLVIDGKINIPI